MLNLVFHQGYERRDDYARAIRRESRHLKRDALASTRRHKAKGIPARTNTLDNLTLDAAEIIITPVLAENVAIDVFFSVPICFQRGYMSSSVGRMSSI